MSAENQSEGQPEPKHEDAIDLVIEYSDQRQSLLWAVEYAGSLSCWSERSLQEAIGGCALAHMEDDSPYKNDSITEYGINFNGHNYNTRDALGAAVIIYLSDRSYRFSGQTLGEQSLILCGLQDEDQAPAAEPRKQLQAQPAATVQPAFYVA